MCETGWRRWLDQATSNKSFSCHYITAESLVDESGDFDHTMFVQNTNQRWIEHSEFDCCSCRQCARIQGAVQSDCFATASDWWKNWQPEDCLWCSACGLISCICIFVHVGSELADMKGGQEGNIKHRAKSSYQCAYVPLCPSTVRLLWLARPSSVSNSARDWKLRADRWVVPNTQCLVNHYVRTTT